MREQEVAWPGRDRCRPRHQAGPRAPGRASREPTTGPCAGRALRSCAHGGPRRMSIRRPVQISESGCTEASTAQHGPARTPACGRAPGASRTATWRSRRRDLQPAQLLHLANLRQPRPSNATAALVQGLLEAHGPDWPAWPRRCTAAARPRSPLPGYSAGAKGGCGAPPAPPWPGSGAGQRRGAAAAATRSGRTDDPGSAPARRISVPSARPASRHRAAARPAPKAR